MEDDTNKLEDNKLELQFNYNINVNKFGLRDDESDDRDRDNEEGHDIKFCEYIFFLSN